MTGRLNGLSVLFVAGAFALPVAGQEGGMDVGRLKADEGAETTYIYCTACHSEMIIAQQGLTRDNWDKLLVWMVEEQGMFPLDEAERTEILDYLATHYNTDRPNFPR